MKLLITGGAGFIGSNFIHYWLKSHPQDRIVNLDNLTYAGNLENLKEVYKKLVKQEIKILKLDVLSSEKDEAEYIKNSFKLWAEIKNSILELADKIEKNWDNKFEENNKSYFG